MKVSSTEVQNNFGKYLLLAAEQDIIITRNGTDVARLCSVKDGERPPVIREGTLNETAEPYHFKGKKATYEEFLALTQDEKDRYEYIDGEIYLLASPKTAHQYAISEMLVIFHDWCRGGPCAPFVAPYDIRLKRPKRDDPIVVQPDLMVICDLDDHLNDSDYYTGVPALIVEVLSESTESKDRVKKLDLYMETGVREYWIVSPANKDVTIYHFENREIKRAYTYKQHETAQSFIFDGLSVDISRIFKS
ncbi:type II toxin-antitoxin system prevent-host-death family antitoxin [Camelliibacillus cellulosilyticus]|uniref:Type II toxin-antitoxin system prevent-host-death family antitoxin n=1 Tax=Camelliibacillus cellulosilyticus TaxID=2174486 RepID=A0ABV9GKZ9_9BACL